MQKHNSNKITLQWPQSSTVVSMLLIEDVEIIHQFTKTFENYVRL